MAPELERVDHIHPDGNPYEVTTCEYEAPAGR